MNKLNEEETKLKQKSCMEIGTWSNDMAKEALNKVERGPPREFTVKEEEFYILTSQILYSQSYIY